MYKTSCSEVLEGRHGLPSFLNVPDDAVSVLCLQRQAGSFVRGGITSSHVRIDLPGPTLWGSGGLNPKPFRTLCFPSPKFAMPHTCLPAHGTSENFDRVLPTCPPPDRVTSEENKRGRMLRALIARAAVGSAFHQAHSGKDPAASGNAAANSQPSLGSSAASNAQSSRSLRSPPPPPQPSPPSSLNFVWRPEYVNSFWQSEPCGGTHQTAPSPFELP